MAILHYVRGGGSIFIIGNQHDPFLLEPSTLYANSIGQLFGIQFSTSISGIYDTFEDHPILTNVSALEGIFGSELIVAPPARAIGHDRSGEIPILAVADDGFGRVVAFTDDTPFYSEGNQLGGLHTQSHLQFASNIAAWLMHLENAFIPSLTLAKK